MKLLMARETHTKSSMSKRAIEREREREHNKHDFFEIDITVIGITVTLTNKIQAISIFNELNSMLTAPIEISE